MKPPKHLLAKNKAVSDNDFIVYTGSPSLLAMVTTHATRQEAELYIESVRPAQFILWDVSTIIEVVKFFEQEPNLSRIDFLLKRMANWHENQDK